MHTQFVPVTFPERGVTSMTALDREEYLTVAEAATLFKVSQSSVWRWINQGIITAYRIGRRGIRLKRAELTRLITPAREGGEKGGGMRNVEHDRLGPLSETEQKAGLAALAELKSLREKMLQERQGVLFPNAAEELHKLRMERTRHLQ